LAKIIILLSIHGERFEIIEEAAGTTLTFLYSATITFNVLFSLGLLLKRLV